MPFRVEPFAEPIPGYRLIERLGGGGFGEVWKAEAPGGLFKAIKFVYGEITIDDSIVIDDPDGSRAKQELKSLGRVKTVHHPYILSLERFDIINGQLIIVMELADKTLWDRFKECRAEGLPGIPREELLNYMEETAEALDLMNTQYQLQHLDIKPQNIFLVFNHIKVADFGLVKDLADKQNATITGGVTPVYAAPETFDGWLSRQSDQYSLAIVFQELLTGHRPFAGSTMKQLILHHLQSAPDLTLLPMADRPTVARALSKNPEERYPSCLEFVRLLRRGGAGNKASSHDIDTTEGSAVTTPRPVDTAPNHTASHTAGHTAGARGGHAGPVRPADPNFSTEDALYGNRPQILPNRPENVSEGSAHGITEHRPAPTPGATPKPKREKTGLSTAELPGIVQPALIIGLGRLGVETLTHVRRRLAEEFGHPDALPQIRLLAIDTDPETLHRATTDPSRAALKTQEVVLSRLQRPAHYLKARDGKLPTDLWLSPKLIYRLPREQTSAGLRALGRLAFVDNFRSISKRIEAELLASGTLDTQTGAAPTQGLGVRSTVPRVYVVTSLMGNTGSGMFIDVAYLAQKLLRDQGHEDAEVIGLFIVPTVRRDASLASALMNTYASLVELQHFSRPESLFMARYETASSSTKDSLKETGPAFHRCMMLPLPESRGAPSHADKLPILALAGEYLYRDLATVLGPAVDEQRRKKLSMSNEWQYGKGPLVQSVNMFKVLWPRHLVLDQCARRLSCQLVTRWMSKDAKLLVETIKPWTQERWEGLGMRPESLIERFQKLIEHALQQTPEQMLDEVLHPLRGALGVGAKEVKDPKAINMAPVVQAMDQFEGSIGSPEENRTATAIHVEPSLIERSLADIAHVIAEECEAKLAELAVQLLEDPSFRLAGAEEALRQFCTTVELSLQSQETLAKELTEKATQLHARILQWFEATLPGGNPTNTTWKINLSRRTVPGPGGASAKDVYDLVRTYAKTRYHSLVLTYLNRLYVGLRGHLSDQIREVGFCRQRLGELLGLLQPAAMPREKKPDAASGERILYPAGCLAMSDAVDRITQAFVQDDLLNFDGIVQKWINANCQALLEVCMGSSSTVKTLAPAMIQMAEVFLDARLRGTSVAEMYLARLRIGNENADADADADTISSDLQSCFDEAAPDLGRLSELNEIALVSLPNDEHGKEVQRLLKRHLPDLNMLMADRQDEMVFYREIISIPWKDLEQLGPIPQEAYDTRMASDPSSLHSREDVAEWQSITTGQR